MTNDPRSGYAIKDENSDYDPDERLDNDIEVASSRVAASQFQKGLGIKGNRDKYGREIADATKYHYSYVDWRPINENETLMECHEAQRGKNTKYRTFVDNPP